MLIETPNNTFLIPIENKFFNLKKICETNWIVCSVEAKTVLNIRNGNYFEKRFSSLNAVEVEYPNLRGIEALLTHSPVDVIYH